MKLVKEMFYEQMTKQEADVLLSIGQEPFINQRILAESTGYSLGMINHCLKHLISECYLDEQVKLTDKTMELFVKWTPQNAIILAAGLGMPMAPINLTIPKALLEIKGERLIDRLITQLQVAGIKDITVIVGFMKDSFEYLIDDYGVELIYNSTYTTKNNISSLALAADRIGNTYILPCDIWCAHNPFRKRELYSWYMVSDLVDASSFVRVNRKLELVKTHPGSDGNGMVGISYLIKEDGKIVRDRIRCLCKDDSYNGKFWEEALFIDDRMMVRPRVVQSEKVVEINTYEQFRALNFRSRNLTSDVKKNIAETMNCRSADIGSIEIQKKGMTNRTFSFEIHHGENAGKYLMRIPGEGTDNLIDRRNEAQVYKTISGLGFCEDPVYLDPVSGQMISRYLEGVHPCDPQNEGDLCACIQKLRGFHNYTNNGKPLTVSHIFDLYERIDFYESLWNGIPSIYRDYQRTKENLKNLQPFIEQTREPFQLTHIDAVADNFLIDPHGQGELSVQLIDWEYAGMQDKHVDIAMFCIYALYNKSQIDHFIDLYFETESGCPQITRAKIYSYIAVCGMIWSNWCEYKRNRGVEFGEYSFRQYRYAKEYYKHAINLIEEIRKEK